MTSLRFAFLAVLLAGCPSDSERSERIVRAEPQPPRRVSAPPVRPRAMPPHAIRADGVGPYVLGDTMSSVMAQLPAGPRTVKFEIPGLVRTSLVRAESDTLLIGGETAGTARFVAVVGPDVARTDSNIHVGSSVDELARATAHDDDDEARDPRLVVPAAIRNARVVVDGERIAAIVVALDPVGTARPAARRPFGPMPAHTGSLPAARPQPEPDCKRPAPSGKQQLGACLAPSGAGELIDVADEELVVHAADGRVIQTLRAPGLVFAAPLRGPTERRDELIAILRQDEPQQRTWMIVVYRADGPRIVRTSDPEVLYQLSSTQARWIGAELRDVELYLELASRPDAIEVGGLLATRTGERVREIALLAPKVVTRRHHKPASSEPADTGKTTTSAGGSAAESGGSE